MGGFPEIQSADLSHNNPMTRYAKPACVDCRCPGIDLVPIYMFAWWRNRMCIFGVVNNRLELIHVISFLSAHFIIQRITQNETSKYLCCIWVYRSTIILRQFSKIALVFMGCILLTFSRGICLNKCISFHWFMLMSKEKAYFQEDFEWERGS